MALGCLWWRAWVPVGAVVAAAVCMAGVALGDIDLHFAWQGWHLATWTCESDWEVKIANSGTSREIVEVRIRTFSQLLN